MIYSFTIISNENDKFARVIEIDAESTFLDFNDALLDSVGYTKDQMTSFFICDEGWERETEITLMEMKFTASDEDNYVMADTRLEELVQDKGQRLLFMFDSLNERMFFIELTAIKKGTLIKPTCVKSKGEAPKQIEDIDYNDKFLSAADDGVYLDEFGSDDFDAEELESEGLNIDDDYFGHQDY
ncbi:MAG: hypothetical protein IKK68_04485 [Paludibacteraceae bacterium]|nr:hypothetical protein [Paludibacteraceae bacterium]